jgi:hypothetical protein
MRHSVRVMRLLTGSLLWYVLFPLELMARRAAIKPSQHGTFLLLDRLPGQPFLSGGLLLRLYQLLLPKPDVIVLLNGDPDEIAGRKPAETSAERTASELAKWEIVARRIPTASIVRVDTTRYTIRACTEFLMQALPKSQFEESGLRGVESTYAA